MTKGTSSFDKRHTKSHYHPHTPCPRCGNRSFHEQHEACVQCGYRRAPFKTPTLLQVASKVEAAVQAYISVQGIADRQEWKEHFQKEFRIATDEFMHILDENPSASPALHPTLVALSIVLYRDEDLGRISRFHPDRDEHAFYDASAEFPSDISDMLPPIADCWWEDLAEAARMAHTVRNPPPAPKVPNLPSVKLVLPLQPPKENRSSSMEVNDEQDGDQRYERPKAAEGAVVKRKQKGSIVKTNGTSKRRAQLKKCPDSDDGDSDSVELLLEQDLDLPLVECHRCMKRGIPCIISSKGACAACHKSKLGCNMIPVNPKTGKTDRRELPLDQLQVYRIKVTKEARMEIRKEKKK